MTMQLTDLAGPDTATSIPPASAPYPSTHLLDMIQTDAAAADARASLGVATFERMLSEGLFHLLVPPEFGGAGATPRQWFDATLAVAHADPSAGWIVAQGAVQNAWLAVAADDHFAREYFATRQTIATSGAGRVPAELVDGTYVVRDAHWSYVSGCTHADYVGGMVVIAGPDRSLETRRCAPTSRSGDHPTELGHPRAARYRQQRRRPRRAGRDSGLAHLHVARSHRDPPRRTCQRHHDGSDDLVFRRGGPAWRRPPSDRGRGPIG